MNLKEIIINTRTVHWYKESDPIEENIIKEALSLSLNAPNHKLTFPWKIYWPREEKKKELIELFVKISSTEEELTRKKYEGISEFLFFSQKLADNEFTRKEDYASLSCSIQLFALALREKGFGYKWSTGAMSRSPEVYDFLGIDAEKEEIVGMVYVGTSLRPLPPRKRPTLDDVLVIR